MKYTEQSATQRLTRNHVKIEEVRVDTEIYHTIDAGARQLGIKLLGCVDFLTNNFDYYRLTR